MIESLIGALAVVVAVLFYRFYIIPKRTLKAYATMLRSKGYKVYEYPFTFMGMPYTQKILSDLKNHKDMLYSHKHDLVGHDIALSHSFATP